MNIFKKKAKVDWNINYEFMRWLNKYFKEYKKNASKIVDLKFHTYKYNDEEYTQLEIINKIIELTDKLSDENYYYFRKTEDVYDECMEVLDLFKIVYWDMWW